MTINYKPKSQVKNVWTNLHANTTLSTPQSTHQSLNTDKMTNNYPFTSMKTTASQTHHRLQNLKRQERQQFLSMLMEMWSTILDKNPKDEKSLRDMYQDQREAKLMTENTQKDSRNLPSEKQTQISTNFLTEQFKKINLNKYNTLKKEQEREPQSPYTTTLWTTTNPLRTRTKQFTNCTMNSVNSSTCGQSQEPSQGHTFTRCTKNPNLIVLSPTATVTEYSATHTRKDQKDMDTQDIGKTQNHHQYQPQIHLHTLMSRNRDISDLYKTSQNTGTNRSSMVSPSHVCSHVSTQDATQHQQKMTQNNSWNANQKDTTDWATGFQTLMNREYYGTNITPRTTSNQCQNTHTKSHSHTYPTINYINANGMDSNVKTRSLKNRWISPTMENGFQRKLSDENVLKPRWSQNQNERKKENPEQRTDLVHLRSPKILKRATRRKRSRRRRTTHINWRDYLTSLQQHNSLHQEE